MSKRSQKGTKSKQPSAAAGRGFLYVALGIGVFALVALAASWNRGKPDKATSLLSGATSNATLSQPHSPAAFQKLIGKWIRPDGGYLLQIQSADSSGALAAAYFNPAPIHVAKAQALEQNSLVKLFVELRDVNYPGSTYSLVYDPRSDQLKGTYFQAVDREQYEILFERVK